jgi:hypothetical protein
MTDQYFLFLLEVGGIQDFIFASNNLQVNIGASALVRAITDVWIREFLKGENTNFEKVEDATSIALSKKCIENDGLDVEIVYIGGGNALMLFKGESDIEKFTAALTKKTLIDAPGISLAFEHTEINLKEGSFKEKLSCLRKALNEKKVASVPAPSLMGLGVTARCAFSGKPAAGIWKDPGGNSKLVSQEVIAKLNYFSQGRRFLEQLTDGVEGIEGYEFVTNFDDFGDKGISSYIAIVHADGNRMGERIKELGKNYVFPRDNRKYIDLLRAFSRSSKDAANKALSLTLTKLVESIQTDKDEPFIRRKYDVEPDQLESLPRVSIRKKMLPFRPIVFGGDDVTFICDGRLGLAMAKEYLQNYGDQRLADEEQAVGRAGVAITPSHYPFSRGYELAEELAGYAKKAGKDGTVQSLDWHFGTNGIVESIKAIRSHSYQAVGKDLIMRPTRLSDDAEYDFLTCEYVIKEFQVGKQWSKRRNKVKALPGLLRDGGDKVSAFLENAQLPDLPCDNKLEQLGDLKKTGWAGSRCYYFDALEAIDFYVPLEV